jgi:enolase
MKITKAQLKQIIKEELDATMKEGGVAANMSPEREPLERMSSSNRPVSSYSRKELKMALAEIPRLENPKYAGHLPDYIPQWIEDVKARAAEMGLIK